MIQLMFVTLAVFVVLVLAEILWRSHKIGGELSRKIIHMLVGVFVASWPYFMSWAQIQLMVLAFFIVIVVSRKWHIFRAIHDSIDRPSWGDMLYPVGIGFCALFAPVSWVFSAAVLHLSVADGLAAIFGKKFGGAHVYYVLGCAKSVVGTSVFILTSFLITFSVLYFGNHAVLPHWPLLVWLPLGAAFCENIGVRGFDNLWVPIFVTLALGANL